MKIALVTGASRGIGAASAVHLAKSGWHVAVNYRSDKAAADKVVERCRATGVESFAVAADVAEDDEVRAMFTAVDENLGPVTTLVNSAGIAVAPHLRVADIPVSRLHRVLAVNVIGSFLCAAQAIPRMSTARGHQGGSIVNLSSVAAKLGSPGEYVDYAASKGAIDSMTVGLAKEVAEEGIRVNAVRPGVIRTEFHLAAGDPGRADRVAGAIPLGRAGEPDEVARLVAWLCSDEASYVTGALMDVSGGR